MVISLERGADLHMTQLMPLPLTVSSCSSKIQIDFTFWYWLTRVVLEKRPLNGSSSSSSSSGIIEYMRSEPSSNRKTVRFEQNQNLQ